MFNESNLEKSVINLFLSQNYEYIHGSLLHKELSEVILLEDFREYLLRNYSDQQLDNDEIATITNKILNIKKRPLYDANKEFLSYITEGFQLNRQDNNNKDLWINLVNFEDVTKNSFKLVNQLEIKGNEKRIPDLVLYVNGLPLVVFEFKSATLLSN